MKKNRKLIVFVIIIFICIIGFVSFVVLQKTKVSDSGLSATVTNIVDKPNQAEDGYYGITAQDNAGHQYVINATGYLNTPLSPDSRGEACVYVPKVKIGDKISFNLPKVDGQSNAFDICYKENLTGYYFVVE